ncbi:FAD-dependent monooxygenase [Thalassococcus sp. BH17M4-6]|uniref:FAD-dependent monooxygenase n=1 Tax=Thalassococcus sp. BH17M4-6 TaxID=3413148 RepID=UPI003BD23E80
MHLSGKSIIVIGGGIGGLACALALRQRGAQVQVLEQAPALREVGAGLQISPNGLRVIEALGLGDGLRACSVRGRAVSLRDHRAGAEVLRLDLGRLPPDQGYHFVHRADLLDLLAQAAGAAGVEVRLGYRVAGVTGGQPATVTLDGGAVLQGDLVLGADGLHSVLRPVLNGLAAPFFTGQVAWRAVVPNTVGQGAEVQVHMGPGAHLVSYPLRDGRSLNLVAVQERADWADEGWTHVDTGDNLRAAFQGFGGPVPAMLADLEAPGLWGLFRHPVARHWHGDGLALLGDAAHPTLPFLAQGANMALEDAWVLAAELARGGDDALARYQQRRRDRVCRVIAAANGNAWKYHLRSPLIRFAAHTALRLGGRLAPGRMLGQFDWLYRHDVTADP